MPDDEKLRVFDRAGGPKLPMTASEHDAALAAALEDPRRRAAHESLMAAGPGAGYWDRLGRPMSLADWAILWEWPQYKIVEDHAVGNVRVVTIWNGFDMDTLPSERETPSYLFSTGVFLRPASRTSNPGKLYDEIYSRTEKEALAVHMDLVRMLLEGKSWRKT